jgi:hypothetical protein
MYVPEVLCKMVLPEAGLDVVNTLARAETTDPRLAWVALLFVPFPVALPSISLSALPSALVNLL